MLTSLIWSLIHLPYNWFYQLYIFGFGLLLGWVRWRSGPATSTIQLYALANSFDRRRPAGPSDSLLVISISY
jgi:membrane protease YdiL (CAAX protease family)